MHEVTPKVVAIAVSIVITTCNTLLQISFFSMIFWFMMFDLWFMSSFFFVILAHPVIQRSIATKDLSASTNSPLERGRGVLEYIHVYASEILRFTPFRSGWQEGGEGICTPWRNTSRCKQENVVLRPIERRSLYTTKIRNLKLKCKRNRIKYLRKIL